MKRFTRVSATFLMAFLVAAIAFPQATPVGSIRGTVTDASGSALPGATVEVTSEDKGFTRTTVTDTNGHYNFSLLPAGRYRVTVSLSGFDTVSRQNNLVESQKNTEINVTLSLGAVAAEITVTGEVPIVDRTSPASETRFRKEELETLPVARSYQGIFTQAPGVSAASGGNPFVHGALSSNNQYQFDGMDVTDPTTGTFGANLNYEAIQEVMVYTSGMSAEYGRAVGGLVNVVTKSGTNTPEGSLKYIAINDEWDEQNKTVDQQTGASLERTKFDQINPRYTGTLGGPILRDRAWFFGAYERSETISPFNITPVTREEYQGNREATYENYRVTFQATPRHNFWGKYSTDPDTGIIRDYWAPGGPLAARFAGEIEALTAQTQGGDNFGLNWTGIFGENFAMEALYSVNDSVITVGALNNEDAIEGGAVHYDLETGFFFNGPTFVGFVDRPRQGAVVSGSYFTQLGNNNHDIKLGLDWQGMESGSQFGYPANRFFEDDHFDPVTRAYTPNTLYVFDEPVPSISEGNIYSLFLRDKFEIGNRVFMEAGIRFDQQEGTSDVGVQTFDSQTFSPRLAASFDLVGNGKTLLVGTAGRFYQFLIQSYTDAFANVPQQGAYSVFSWNGTEFVQTDRVDPTSNNLQPVDDLDPTFMDEVTVGFEQQIGNTIGVGVRGVFREWDDIIDDVITFTSTGRQFRQFVNYEPAQREYMGVEFTFDKRFSRNWSANLNYTYSEAEGNTEASFGSTLGDFIGAECRTTVDLTIGNNGRIPCDEVQNGANKFGLMSFNRPHYVKGLANYSVPLGPVNLTLGMAGNWRSGFSYTPQRSLNVVNPVTGVNVGTATYFYEGRGSRELDPVFEVDTSLEATWRLWRSLEFGVKGEVFNVTDEQEQVTVNNLTWCEANTAACQTTRNFFGMARTRAAYQLPRQFRITGLIRF